MLVLLLTACFPRLSGEGDLDPAGGDDSDAAALTETRCGDDVDDDDDGATDCDDPDCADAPVCDGPGDSGDSGDSGDTPLDEDCGNDEDDDDDGDVDCEDDDCVDEPDCDTCWDTDADDALGEQIASGSGSGDDGAGSCGGAGTADRFVRWTAPATDTFVFDTVGSDGDTTLWVAQDECDGQELACDEDTFGSDAQVAVSLAQGDVVVVGVEGAGSWVLNAWQGECPAYSIGSTDGVQGTTSSSLDTYESTCGDVGAAVTLRWIAPSSGTWVFSTVGSDFDTLIALYDGDCEGAELGCDDDASYSYGPSEVSVSLSAGDVVAIAVGGYDADTGDYLLSISAE